MSNCEIEKHSDSDLFLNELRKHNTGLDSNHIIDELISEKTAFSKKELAKELKNRIAAKDAQLKIARDFIEDVPHDDSCHRWSSIHSTTLGCVCGKDKALKQIGGVK